MAIDLTGSPYGLEETGQGVIDDVGALMERISLLRGNGELSEATLRAYFGDKRFEQIAESNALEGSTLDVGETQLAVLRGVTITGHDPAYSKDAIALANALDRITELARSDSPTDIDQLKEIHSLVLGDRPGSGVFRTEPVRIGGSNHRPPATWNEIMNEMESWDEWSHANVGVPALVRGAVLHTWLTHIHPFIDGNGRTARAILNLELIRGGIPSVIIRRKDRERYLDALGESDAGGNLGPIIELVLDRTKDALRDLERVAKAQQGYDEASARLRARQEKQLAIWNDAVKLLFSLLEEAAEQSFGTVGSVRTRWYDDRLLLEDFIALSQGDSAGNSWLFRIGAEIPAVGSAEYLAWTGFRSRDVQRATDSGPGPAIFWSVEDPSGYRKWMRDEARSPGGAELTLELPSIDKWVVRQATGEIEHLSPSAVVRRIVAAMEASLEM